MSNPGIIPQKNLEIPKPFFELTATIYSTGRYGALGGLEKVMLFRSLLLKEGLWGLLY
jgi:hypothetical protein